MVHVADFFLLCIKSISFCREAGFSVSQIAKGFLFYRTFFLYVIEASIFVSGINSIGQILHIVSAGACIMIFAWIVEKKL